MCTLLNRGGGRARRCVQLEGAGPYGEDVHGIVALHVLQSVAGVDVAHECVGRVHFDHVRECLHVKCGSDARHDALAERVGGEHYVAERVLLLERGDNWCHNLYN